MKEYVNKIYMKFNFNIVIDKVKIIYMWKGRRNNIFFFFFNLMCRVIFFGILVNYNFVMYIYFWIFNIYWVYVDIGVRFSM